MEDSIGKNWKEEEEDENERMDLIKHACNRRS